MTGSETRSMLKHYAEAVRLTDRLPEDNLRPVLMGLFGEVGSIMAPAKKLHREKDAYIGYLAVVEEEFGDTLWYLTALIRRTSCSLQDVMASATEKRECSGAVATSDISNGQILNVLSTSAIGELDEMLLDLGTAASALLILKDSRANATELLEAFALAYILALDASQILLSRVVRGNLAKTRGRFLKPDVRTLPNFDEDFDEDERLPSQFEISIKQRANGQSCLQWHGVFIGDPLTDSILDADGYRFHDVFHCAHAAILHWSPTFRALIKHKRKSNKVIDEAQDGGRAIVIEEGLTAWLFSRAKDHNFFENQDSVAFDLLKTVHQFVRGYEVEDCPLNLWEDAILQGYAVFRQVRAHNGGWVIGDRNLRTIQFRSLSGSAS